VVEEKQNREVSVVKRAANIVEIALFISFLMLSGCTSMFDDSSPYPKWWEKGGSQGYQERYVRDHPELSPDIKEELLHGYIKKGMTKEQVQLFSDFRLGPTKVKPTTKHEADEMWIFDYPSDPNNKKITLYFKSGLLVWWEREENGTTSTMY